MTFVKRQNAPLEATVNILFSQKASGKSSGYQFPALATLIYADWVPQVNGPP